MNISHSLITLMKTRISPAILRGSPGLLLAVVILSWPPLSFSQNAADHPQVEIYAGYSQARFKTNIERATFTNPGGAQTFTDLCGTATGQEIGPNSQKFFCRYRGFNGFDGSVTYNLTRYVGVKGDFTAHFKSDAFVDVFTPPGVTQTLANRERLYNFLGGVQIKNNSRNARIKPFVHALAGVARYTNTQRQTLDLFPQFNFTIEDRVTSFALKVGGGLDVRVSRRLDIRVFEFDYNPAFSRNRNPTVTSGGLTSVSFTGRTANTYTFGAGIVIH
jgi:Outer membrane protein beta-barrel domain